LPFPKKKYNRLVIQRHPFPIQPPEFLLIKFNLYFAYFPAATFHKPDLSRDSWHNLKPIFR